MRVSASIANDVFLKVGSIFSCLIAFSWVAADAFAANEKLVTGLKDYINAASGDLGSGLAIGYLVVDLDTDETIVAESEEELLVPASLSKLLLSLTALKTLGGQYHFPTEVFVDHPPTQVDPEGKERVDFKEPVTSVGNLYIRGYGDPTMDSLRLIELAETVRLFGVDKVKDVVLDDSLFTSSAKNTGPRPSEAGTSALSVNHNCYGVYVAPARPAFPAAVSVTPGLNFRIINQVLTMRGKEQSIAVDLQPSSLRSQVEATKDGAMEAPLATVTVRGTIGANAGGLVLWQALPDIPAAFENLLRFSLQRAGVSMNGRFVRGEVPPNAALLQSFPSKSLAEVLREMNQQSSNMFANQIAHALGQDDKGYFRYELGLRRMRQQLEQLLGGKRKDFEILDASGLERGNRLSPRHLALVLREAARDFAVFPDFVGSLGHFGESGTLKSRMLIRDAEMKTLRPDELRKAKLRTRSVWAKTGTLEGVSALAGYAVTKSNERVIFVLIENNVKDKQTAVEFEDGFVRTLIGITREPSQVEVPLF